VLGLRREATRQNKQAPSRFCRHDPNKQAAIPDGFLFRKKKDLLTSAGEQIQGVKDQNAENRRHVLQQREEGDTNNAIKIISMAGGVDGLCIRPHSAIHPSCIPRFA